MEDNQNPELQHPYHPDEDLQDEEYLEDQTTPQEFFQVLVLEEFVNSDSQIVTNMDIDIKQSINKGFFVSFLIYAEPPKIDKQNPNQLRNIFATGNHARKNIELSVNNEGIMILTCRVGKAKNQVFSQQKLKNHTPTHIFIQLEQIEPEDVGQNYQNILSIFINGELQGQIALTKQIEPPSGFLFIGSEHLPVFKGEIQDMVFGVRPLNREEQNLVITEKQMPLQQQRPTFDILDEYNEQIQRAQLPQRKETQSAAERHSIPLALSKTHLSFVPQQRPKQEELKEDEILKLQMEKSREQVEQLLLTNDVLNMKCREMCSVFKWIFNTLQEMSPPLEDKGSQGLPFAESLNNLVQNDGIVDFRDVFPYYGIEFDRFMKVIKYAKLSLTKAEIELLAKTSEWARTYRFVQDQEIKEYENKKYGYINAIIYDKFMITIRDACMSKEEIKKIRNDCGGDPHQFAPKIGDEIEFDSYEEFFKTCKRNGIDEDQARQYIYKGLVIKSMPMRGGKQRICCSRDPRLLLYNKIIELYPDIKFNENTQEVAYYTLSNGEREVNLEAFTDYCINVLKLWGGQTNEQQQALDNTHSKMNHFENQEETCKKLFYSFCFQTEPFFGFSEFITLIRATYPAAIYEHPETGKQLEITPYSSYPQVIVWGDTSSMIENNYEQQLLGEIKFKNDQEINFYSAQYRLLNKQHVQWSIRDNEYKKKYNTIGKSDYIFGNWSMDNPEYDFDIQYFFGQKQKLKIEFFNDDQKEGQVKFQLSDIVGQSTMLTNMYQTDFQIGSVSGKINISRQIEQSNDSNGQQFYNYLAEGLKFNIMVGIDWTASNQEVDNPQSLHYYDPENKEFNQYQQILRSLCSQLLPFDVNKKIAAYGFGASPTFAKQMGGTFDCFPMNGNPEEPEVENLQGFLDVYEKCRKEVELSGPTYFSGIMSSMVKIVNQKTFDNYSVAIIISDGAVSDQLEEGQQNEIPELQKIINLVVEQSEKPVTFLFVGIGQSDLTQYKIFNNYQELKHHTNGKNPIRQNSVFINYSRECQDGEDLVKKVLPTVQAQALCYYKMHNVEPQQMNIFTDKTKTPMHILHPEHFVQKEKKEEFKQIKKGGKIIKKKIENDKPEFIPKYKEVSPENEIEYEERNPFKLKIHVSIKQDQSQNGRFRNLFDNQTIPEINPEELNFSQQFYDRTKKLAGFKTTMTITEQVISDIPSENFLTLNACNFNAIAPIYDDSLQSYDFPKENQEDKEILPKPCEQWNQGKLLLNLQRCAECIEHQGTSRHDEADFAEKQNQFYELFKQVFPNLELQTNLQKPNILEGFDIYIRGVGPENKRDSQGRVILYKKEDKLLQFQLYFQRLMLIPYDKLVLLCSAYADSKETELVQQDWFENNQHLIPEKWEKCNEGQANIPDRPKDVERQKKEESSIPVGAAMKCFNWACGQEYQHVEDKMQSANQCTYHKGVYQMGSIHGYWPESWTCCRKEWEAPGCTKGSHKGQQISKLKYLCVNRGEVNNRTKKPDSICGKTFSPDTEEDCQFHPGYIFKKDKKNKNSNENNLPDDTWTCCQQDSSAEPCNKTKHFHAEWPDERAKLYFIEKKQNKDFRDNKIESFESSGLRSCIYRETVPYVEYESSVTRKARIQRENENQPRICMRYGCKFEGTYKDSEQQKLKELKQYNCFMHTGVFDFGKKEDEEQFSGWAPHWTCCRQDWSAKGCQRCYHSGPLESEFKQNPPKNGKWPNISAMKNFKKEGSSLWRKKFAEYEISDEDRAKMKFNQFSKGQSYISSSDLKGLCQHFKLHLFAMSEDLSFHFKYSDVLTGKAEEMLDPNNSGQIQRDEFIKWWLTSLEDYQIQYNE
ncbi:Concanavalin A-like lectin/glucanases superfamily [Pseudocohnilembus persalinus]|uniref:Concanavalin A-like lectin/glucanases superfamily n=1 Tax=Pseudocohnilembus persalinus TaxID=266149 RepID=A0A0V0QUT2_PSEPJ|nr:Concanavalin A-like lectin/glucanases superfamily [Pseudocohnilembus persalinus]|eukprot:KRX05621.1 Concanavalin A-like lectin/glucanases superfamily [Pseudocohnilembus persalinus]